MGILLVTVETNVARVCPPVQEVSTQKYSMFFQEDISFCHYADFKFPTTMQGTKDRLGSGLVPRCFSRSQARTPATPSVGS